MKIERVSFPPSADWTTVTLAAEFRRGLNSLAFQSDSDDRGTVELDGVSIEGAWLAERGATLPFETYEAEDAESNGKRIGPGRDYFTLEAEASGRQAVQLERVGDYVEFSLRRPANALTIRYSIPDSEQGGGLEAPLSLYIDGALERVLTLTSKYTWVYGAYPYVNDPREGKPRHYYDDVRLLLGRELPAGTKVRLRKDADDSIVRTIDLIDAELAPAPYAMPAGFVSIADCGAVPNDGLDDTDALLRAIAAVRAGEGQGVWIPEGVFHLARERIPAEGVHIRGAGPWHSVLAGAHAGFYSTREDNDFRNLFFDFAIFGETHFRIDAIPDNAFDDNMGTGTIVQNVWIEHKKCAAWINWPTEDMLMLGTRQRNLYADGVNYAGGTRNCRVEQSHIRGAGDDSLATWSSIYKTELSNEGNGFAFNSIELQWLANGIAIYGGKDHYACDNLIRDSVGYGGGINISTNFPCVPFGGTITVSRNTMTRTGGWEDDWIPEGEYFGAIWIYASKYDIDADIRIVDNEVIDATYSGLEIQGFKSIAGLLVDGLRIAKTGRYGLELRDNLQGAGTFRNVRIEDAPLGNVGTNGLTGFRIDME